MIEYRELTDFPGYRVGTDGSLWSKRHRNGKPTDTWRLMSPGVSPKGYRVAVVRRPDGSRFAIRMSRLLLTTFIGAPFPGAEACHGDGVRSNDALSNLRWDTSSGNQQDRVLHGTANIGERSGRARLTRANVLYIRQRLSVGIRISDLAREFGVSHGAVSCIKRGKSWSWL
jgi:hypothetical protein